MARSSEIATADPVAAEWVAEHSQGDRWRARSSTASPQRDRDRLWFRFRPRIRLFAGPGPWPSFRLGHSLAPICSPVSRGVEGGLLARRATRHPGRAAAAGRPMAVTAVVVAMVVVAEGTEMGLPPQTA